MMGGSVGNFGGDAIRNIYGICTVVSSLIAIGEYGALKIELANGTPVYEGGTEGALRRYANIFLDASKVVPTDTDNHPAFLSALYVISY